MRTMVLELSVPRFAMTRLLGRLAPGAHFGPWSPVRMLDLADPPLPAPDWVRVRNRLCGICGSDLHQLFLDVGLDVAPAALPAHRRTYPGHEMVGEVVEAGPAVTDLGIGDRVVRWGRGDDCRARGSAPLCPACARGHRVLCEFASEPREHEPVGGGYSDSFIAPASTLVRVLPGLADEQAILTEPAAVALHAAGRHPPKAGDQVLVLGCGPVGFLLIQVLRILEPACIVTTMAQFPWQAELAHRYGAHDIFLAGDEGYAETARRTGARLYVGRGGNRMLMGGFDAIYDVVGTAATLNQALRWARAGGAVILVGANLNRMLLDLTPVWYQEVDLIGSVGHGLVTWEGETLSTFELVMRWMLSGEIQCEGLVTHRFPLDQYRRAFLTAADKGQHRSVKVAFEIGQYGLGSLHASLREATNEQQG